MIPMLFSIITSSATPITITDFLDATKNYDKLFLMSKVNIGSLPHLIKSCSFNNGALDFVAEGTSGGSMSSNINNAALWNDTVIQI